jgi:hypothetical protein
MDLLRRAVWSAVWSLLSGAEPKGDARARTRRLAGSGLPVRASLENTLITSPFVMCAHGASAPTCNSVFC